jgi:hypothetical protein
MGACLVKSEKSLNGLSIPSRSVRRVSRERLSNNISQSPQAQEKEILDMRFMMIVKANKDSEAGVMPSKELLEAMGKFNEEMAQAGVMLSGEGLHASSKGARVKLKAGAVPTVVDGPFTETKELIAGFWINQVKSKEEAIEWAKRCPPPHPGAEESVLELRQVFDAEDFGPEVAASEQVLRDQIQKQHGQG